MASDFLAAALEFFSEKMDIFITVLTSDITTYNGGTIWNAICSIYTTLIVIGVTLANIFIWAELIESTTRWLEIRRSSVLLMFLIEIVVVNVVIYYSKEILLSVYSIIQGVTKSIMQSTGIITPSGDSFFHVAVPQEFRDAVDSLPISTGFALFIVIIIVAGWICISTMGVVMIVYIRIFNLYILIALSPLAFACAMSRKTRFIFTNFLKNFVSVSLESVVLVLTLYIFKMFFEQGNTVDISGVASQGSRIEGIPDYIFQLLYTAAPGWFAAHEIYEYFGNNGSQNFMLLFMYLLEMAFLFAVMLGMVKGSEKMVNKIFGL